MTSQPKEVNFPVTFSNDTAIVQVPARLSVLEAVAFKQTCQEITQANPDTKQIIIDFHQTIFMDSSGLGALVSNLKIAQEKNIEFILRNVT
ncbi:MAG: STAS domain-containing protein, partial [Microcystaceae cyanobacterium]